MSERTTGYAILLVGILFISVLSIHVILVLSGSVRVPVIFEVPPLTLTLDPSSFADPGSIQGYLLNQTNFKQELELVPRHVMEGGVNMLLYVLLMGLLVNIAYRIALVGTSLLRPIEAKVYAKDSSANRS